jgi:hypothetical protein
MTTRINSVETKAKSVARLYFWRAMGTDAEAYIYSCYTCIAKQIQYAVSWWAFSSPADPSRAALGYRHGFREPLIRPLPKLKGDDIVLII